MMTQNGEDFCLCTNGEEYIVTTAPQNIGGPTCSLVYKWLGLVFFIFVFYLYVSRTQPESVLSLFVGVGHEWEFI